MKKLTTLGKKKLVISALEDIKARDIELASGTRPAGSAVHDLSLRITINRDLEIVDAEAASDSVPSPGYCDSIGPAYKKLIGMSLAKHFRLHLKDRLSGVLGLVLDFLVEGGHGGGECVE